MLFSVAISAFDLSRKDLWDEKRVARTPAFVVRVFSVAASLTA